MSRRKGRILAFQGLYSYDVGGVSLDSLLELEWDQKEQDADSEEVEQVETAETAGTEEQTKDYARLLIAGAVNHLDEIDGAIKAHLSEKWELSRINKVTLAILRLSVFELMYQKELHSKIVIDEAIRIAKEYGADDSYKFINAILDSISKDNVEK